MMEAMSEDPTTVWGDHDVEGRPRTLRLGPLRISVASAAGELRLAWAHDDRPPEWSRWAPGDWSGRIRLTPVHPDRLVVVKPEREFRLLRGARARVYLRVPLHVRLEALGTTPRTLVTVPTDPLADTWWGTPLEGELGYWLDTRARRAIQDDEFLEHLCICPLQLENDSSDHLMVDRIALRVAHLSVYRDGTRLWSDETRVRYLGEEAWSRIEMAGRAPTEAAEAERVTPPTRPLPRGFTARTFARLKSSIEEWL